MSNKKKFYLIISLATLISLAGSYFLTETITGYKHLAIPFTILCGLFGVIALVNGYILFSYVEKRPQVFIRAFMGSFTLKFFINLTILGSYLYNFHDGRIPIVILFFFLFTFFTVAEKVLIFKAFNESETA